ncbi:hypothetical protein BJ944DRAFT_226949 [Cunninghamella echinulata]|nr:hypothetical protein BJ944DRAFT_226949 [Cunninghamella echinulata]
MSSNVRPILNDYDLSDIIDLNNLLTNDNDKLKHSNNIHSKKRNSYNISLESVTDEELQKITRSLITPIPFHRSVETNKNKTDISLAEDCTSHIPTFRSESAAIFNELNNDDDLSVDFVYSDLRDFIDPVLLEGVISRPVSRAPLLPQRNLQKPVVANSQINLKYQLNNAQITSRKYSLDSVEMQYIDDITKKSQKISLNNSEEDNIKIHKNNHQVVSNIGNEQKYIGDKQPINPLLRKGYQINNDNTKRHSLDAQTLALLRRDSDALLQRRQSLLKLHNMPSIDDITVKKPSNKSTTSFNKLIPEGQTHGLPPLNCYNDDKYLPSCLTIKDERKGKQNFTYQSNSSQFEQNAYHDTVFPESFNNLNNKVNKQLLAKASDRHSDVQKNRTVRRYRSISFPDQTKNKQIYRNTHDGNDYNIAAVPTAKHSQSGPNRTQVLITKKQSESDRYQNTPEFEKKRIFPQTIKTSTAQPFEMIQPSNKSFAKVVNELPSSSSSSSSSLLSPPSSYRLSLKQSKYSLSDRKSSQFDRYNKAKNDDSKNTSVTESAKNVIANIRQRRISGHQRLTPHDESKKKNIQHKENAYDKPYQISNYFELENESNELQNSNLPISSSTDTFGMIDEIATLDNGKFNKASSNANQSKKRHSYVTKKSTLNRNTDRYISLLGKPPSAKAD